MRKQYNQKRYDINKHLSIKAWTEDTSYGFRHLVQLQDDFAVIGQTKACYYNRTWEQYDYESVIHNLIDGSNIRNKKATKKKIDDQALGRVRDSHNTIGLVMALGDIFGNDQKESNDWKLRMAKAGLNGLDVPEDWDQLTEDEKSTRLNKVLEELRK